jgi:alpha-glucoside transport system substrate-binding protein
MKSRVWRTLSVLAVLALLAVACQSKTVVVTQEVTKEVQKVVTATAAPVQAGADTGTVTILGAFRGAEETAFGSVISAFEAQNPNINIIYSGTAEFETLISVRVEAGDPPDIAAFPQPGAVAKLAREGKLVPLWSEALAAYDANYPPYWKELSQVDGTPYAMFHRVNAKGWIWYNKAAWAKAGYQVPTTWDELMTLTDQMKSTGISPWGDGIESGAATGWKGTDWIENIMLRTQPVSVYDDWTAGKLAFSSDQVKNAWSYLTAIWMDPTEVYGGPQTVAVTNFRDPATWLFDDPPKCWMHMQGSFVTAFFQQSVQDNLDQDVGVFMMPPIDDSLPFTLEVGGDEYVVFVGKDRPEVRKFIEFLGTPEAGKPWAELGGALFPYTNQDLSWYPTELDRNMAQAIINAKGARFDASDNMPSALNLAFWKGVTDWVSGSRTLDEALSDIDQALPQ